MPVFTTELVMFARAVTAMISNAENRVFTVSTAEPSPDISTFLAALSMLSRPFVAPSISKLFFNFSMVDKLV